MDTKFHHCAGIHCLDHSSLNEMYKLRVTVTSHLLVIVTLTFTNNPTPKSHLHSVNWSPIWLVQVIFHPLGCAQPTNTLHTPSTPPQSMHLLSFTRKDRYLVSIFPETNHSKITFHIQQYLSQQF